MILVLEIMLTVSAWKRGWKSIALIPLGFVLLLGFVIGGIIGANGGNPDEIMGISFILDILFCIVPLIVMNSRPRKDTNDLKVADQSATVES